MEKKEKIMKTLDHSKAVFVDYLKGSDHPDKEDMLRIKLSLEQAYKDLFEACEEDYPGLEKKTIELEYQWAAVGGEDQELLFYDSPWWFEHKKLCDLCS